MSDILYLDLLNFDALEESMNHGRVLSDEEVKYLCDYFMARPDRSPLLNEADGIYPAVTSSMRTWLECVASQRHPDANAERFTWRVRRTRILGDPMLWFRNDQTGLMLLYYRPEASELHDMVAILHRCIRAVFPVLNIRSDITELYLQQTHIVQRYAGTIEPEDAWLELTIPRNVSKYGIAYNMHAQKNASLKPAYHAIAPETRTPIELLSRVLHALSRRDPMELGGIFMKRSYTLRVRIEQAREEDDGANGGFDFHPISELQESTRHLLIEGKNYTSFDIFLPEEDNLEQQIEADANETLYALANNIHSAFGWQESWNSFSSPEYNFTAFDGDEPVGAFKDYPPEESRTTSDMLLSEYFETRSTCIYNGSITNFVVSTCQTSR